ncbi:MAG: Flp pilus assembly protein CpaB [Actinobacteria bacterium]|nr:Flp pilus assembly protein CpaB [Actinomycetota bacterium]
MLRRKWPTASKVYLVLAIVSGLAAFGLSRGYARRLEMLHPEVGPDVPVVFAAVDVGRGATLTASQLEVRREPSAFVPPGAFGQVSQVAGRVVVADVAAGEPLTRTRVSAPGAGPVAALVPPGLLAFPIDAGVPQGTVRRGDRVDVLATYGGGHPHTEIVATGLEVLLALEPSGNPGSASSGGAGVQLVLLVSPDAAEQLAYAAAFGDLAVAIEGTPAPPT